MKSQRLLLIVTSLLLGVAVHAQNAAPDSDSAAPGTIRYPENAGQVPERLNRALITTNSSRKELLMQSTTSWDGGAITYPEGEAEITAVRLVIQEGELPAFHCHPIPTFGYVAHGSVQVETRNGDITTLEEGQVLTEVMNTVHRGISLDGRAELIVFYAGAKGVATTLPEESPGDQPCLR